MWKFQSVELHDLCTKPPKDKVVQNWLPWMVGYQSGMLCQGSPLANMEVLWCLHWK